MSNKMIITGSVLALVFATAMPVYAQSTTPQVNQGFFTAITTFIDGFFHHQPGANGQTQEQSGPNQPVPTGQSAPSGSMQPTPSGMPDYTTMQQMRLSFLVSQGKITQAQEQEIMTELTSVQSQLTTWAQSAGINPAYVLGGPIGGGGGVQQGGFRNVSNQGQGYMQHFRPGTQSGNQQGQPAQQSQGQEED
jgi:hypothetical protein